MDFSPLYILDSYGLIYREYFAFISHPLLNDKGQNVSALFGFFRNLAGIISRNKPEFLIAAFDSRTPTFRHKIYKDYKATRQKTPDDLLSQIPLIEEALNLLKIPVLRCDGYEADDVIATLAMECEKNDRPCKILSADKDLMQLVTKNVHILKPDKDKIWQEINEDAVKIEWGVEPKKLLDLLSLAGDSADNIPGVSGVGVKTAAKLIHDFGDFENIFLHANEIKGALGKKILQGKESAFFSRDLVKLCQNVPLECDFENFLFEKQNCKNAVNFFLENGVPKIAKIFEELSEKKIENQEQTQNQKIANPKNDEPVIVIKKNDCIIEEIFNFTEFEKIFSDAKKSATIFSFSLFENSVQTDENIKNKENFLADFDVFAFSFAENLKTKKLFKNYFIRLNKNLQKNKTQNELFGENFFPSENEENLKSKLFLKIKEILKTENLKIAIHDSKSFFKAIFKNENIEINAKIFDTQIAAWLLNPEKICDEIFGKDPTSLKYLAHKNLALIPAFDSKIEKEKSTAENANLTLKIFLDLSQKLKKHSLEKIFYEIEMKLTPILSEIEMRGIHLEPSILRDYKTELETEICALKEKIFSAVGHEFNIASQKQLQIVLFEELGLKSARKIKTGYSTNSDFLEEAAKINPVPNAILDFRAKTKLLTTYIDPLLKLADSDFRVHTTFDQTGTATGRLSSKEPNLQNIPVRDEGGRRIRKAFFAEHGKILISADYAQIELVVLAHLSGDKNLCEAFRAGVDVHKATAALIYKIPAEKVDSKMRRTAKTINFGIMYGMSAFSLANDLDIPIEDAKNFIFDYFRHYSGVKKFLDDVILNAEKNGFVKTMFERKRRIQNISSKNYREIENAKRIAINTPIQGTAADIVKKAMISVDCALKKNPTGARLLLQIHDELIFDCPDDEGAITATKNLIRKKMEEVVTLKVPLKVSIETGKSWGEFH